MQYIERACFSFCIIPTTLFCLHLNSYSFFVPGQTPGISLVNLTEFLVQNPIKLTLSLQPFYVQFLSFFIAVFINLPTFQLNFVVLTVFAFLLQGANQMEELDQFINALYISIAYLFETFCFSTNCAHHKMYLTSSFLASIQLPLKTFQLIISG